MNKHMKSSVTTFLVMAAVCLSLFACQSESVEEGVVARVNGKPIYLHELEAKYDLMHLGWTGGMGPSVNRLKREYGDILSELIIQALVSQALEKNRLEVTDEEMEQAEAEVRADYPKGAFEQLLVEEYIDIQVWREQLRAHLARKKFMGNVLLPEIRLAPEEAEAYYSAHQTDFILPARDKFLLISGPDSETVVQAAQTFIEEGDVKALKESFHSLSIQELSMRRDRLPANWSQALAGMGIRQASEPAASEDGVEVLVLLETFPEKRLDLTQAYPLIEKILVEQKLQQAFSDWLAKELDQAQILVSEHLIPGNEEEEEELAAETEEHILDELEQGVEDYHEYSNATVGRLFVQVVPDTAMVRIMNIKPVYEQGMELEQGVYRVQVEQEGFETHEEETLVHANEDTVLDVALIMSDEEEQPDTGNATKVEAEEIDSENGKLFVQANPEDAEVRILNIGPKFEQGMELAPGEYVVQVRAQGYAEQVHDVSVSKGKEVTLSVTLEKVN